MTALTPDAARVPGDVAVVTVSYNSGAVLGAFLDSARKASAYLDEVVVVDNASSDAEEIRETVETGGARFLPLSSNLGYGSAMNRGVASLRPTVRWVVLANPDVEFADGAIDDLVGGALARPDAGAVGPRVLTSDGTTYPSARRLPSLRVGIGHALLGRALPRNPWTRLYRAEEMSSDHPRDAGWLSGACVLVVRRAFEEIGGFDEAFFMYFEDVDLGARIGSAGLANVYWPFAVVTHSGAHSTSTRIAQMERAHHASAYRYVARKYHQWYLWPLRALLWVGIAIRRTALTRS